MPGASRGAKLFLVDPLSRQFLLCLRALADRSDGVAETALLRPPFFVLALADLLRDRVAATGHVPEDAAACFGTFSAAAVFAAACFSPLTSKSAVSSQRRRLTVRPRGQL